LRLADLKKRRGRRRSRKLVSKLIVLSLNQVNEKCVDFTTVHLAESRVLKSLDVFDKCE